MAWAAAAVRLPGAAAFAAFALIAFVAFPKWLVAIAAMLGATVVSGVTLAMLITVAALRWVAAALRLRGRSGTFG